MPLYLLDRYDPKRSLFEQFAGKQPGLEDSIDYVRCFIMLCKADMCSP